MLSSAGVTSLAHLTLPPTPSCPAPAPQVESVKLSAESERMHVQAELARARSEVAGLAADHKAERSAWQEQLAAAQGHEQRYKLEVDRLEGEKATLGDKLRKWVSRGGWQCACEGGWGMELCSHWVLQRAAAAVPTPLPAGPARPGPASRRAQGRGAAAGGGGAAEAGAQGGQHRPVPPQGEAAAAGAGGRLLQLEALPGRTGPADHLCAVPPTPPPHISPQADTNKEAEERYTLQQAAERKQAALAESLAAAEARGAELEEERAALARQLDSLQRGTVRLERQLEELREQHAGLVVEHEKARGRGTRSWRLGGERQPATALGGAPPLHSSPPYPPFPCPFPCPAAAPR